MESVETLHKKLDKMNIFLAQSTLEGEELESAQREVMTCRNAYTNHPDYLAYTRDINKLSYRIKEHVGRIYDKIIWLRNRIRR